MSTVNVPLEFIQDNPYQPRLTDDPEHIEKLARSIASDGLQQKPKAREISKGEVQLAFGHSRRKAFEWLCKNYAAQGLPERYTGYSMMPLETEEMDNETMYRLAVTENVQRKDLGAIELAKSMLVYRDQFGKSSAEIGALYGMSDSTVRGMLRLLDLHPDAQNLLAAGKITQGIARTLLSAQKILDEKTLNGLFTKIADTSVDEHEDLIDGAIDRSQNSVEMWGQWDSERGGKPRAGRELWLLDMKNFPNKLLEDLSVVEAAELLGIQKDKADYEILKQWMLDYDQGAETTDEGWNALASSGLHQEHTDRLRHLLNPPACNVCPFYAMVNKTHYCGVRACRERKAKAFGAQKLADMSRTLKIAIYQESDGAYLFLDDDIAAHKKAFEARHADLRLLPISMVRGYAYQSFKDADSSTAKIVAVGESANKLDAGSRSSAKKGGKKTEKEKAEMRAMRLYRARRLVLTWEYTATAQVIFEGVPLKALQKVRSWHYVGVDDAIPEEGKHADAGTDDNKLVFARRALVWGMIVDQSSHYRRFPLVKMLELFEKVTGVKASKTLLTRAEEWDAEIEQLATPVAAETPAKKTKK